MAQILVRNLPDDAKARLQRRADLHKRSLEAEVRDILVQIPEPKRANKSGEGIGTMLAKKFAANPIPDEDWEIFERGMREARRSWRVRDVDFDK